MSMCANFNMKHCLLYLHGQQRRKKPISCLISIHLYINYPGTMLPPITSAYKRKYEDEDEYDSEMDDFIDDGGDEQEEISKHIKEIFGYDRSR